MPVDRPLNNGNPLIINQENTDYRVTGSFNDGEGPGDFAIRIQRIQGGKHEMTFSGVTITMSKPNSKAMNLENNTTLNLVLEEGLNNTITYGGNMSKGISLTNSSLFISGEGWLTIRSDGMSSEPAISGDKSSTVAITGGTINLNGNILMNDGTLIIGPEAKVRGNVPESAYDAGFVFVNDAKEAQVQDAPELPVDLTIPEGYTLNVPEGTSLTVPEGVTLTVNGELTVEGELKGAGAIRVETGGSITGAENISGTVQHKLTEKMVVIEKDSYTYTGEAITPKVTITLPETIEEEYTQGEDYTVTYENNTDAGEATITIMPIGSLFGDEVTKKFNITQAKNEWITAPTIKGWTYNETPNTPSGAAKFGEVSFTYAPKDSKEYSETAPTDAGDYVLKATVESTDNYTGLEETVEFTIEKDEAILSFAEDAKKIKVGETCKNVLTVEPTGLAVTYFSENTDMATVSQDGTVTAVAVGEVKITAKSADPNYTGEATYTLEVEAGEVEISRPDEQEQTITLEAGGTAFTLTATITGLPDSEQNGNWEWVSSDTDIATVEEIETLSTRAGEVNTEIKSEALVTPVGEGTATITVTYESTNYKGTLTYDVSVKAKEEEPAPKPDPTPLYYNIQFKDVCEGVDASLSKGVVKEGNQVSVYVEVEEGYNAENLKVLFKRSLYGYWEEVEEGVQPGEYIIYNVYADIYVKVEGVEKIEEEPTGMSDIEGIKVYTQNGNLYIYTSQPQEVMIITMNGTILKRERQEGLRSYSLPKGVYIICIGEERMKVRN